MDEIMQGSPLHMRGLRTTSIYFSFLSRITPAYAGTTVCSLIFFSLTWDHPCICGDYIFCSFAYMFTKGSPLHMRGLLRKDISQTFKNRITPAYAGTTFSTLAIPSPLEDHPCICGDYGASLPKTVYKPGSPLHMRGLRSPTHSPQFVCRITPAYAGTTHSLPQ